MAALATQQITYAGLAPAYVAVGGSGDTVAASDRTFVSIKNGSGVSTTVTIAVPGNQEIGVPNDDVEVTVLAGAEKWIGPLPGRLFNDPTDRRVHVTCSPTATITIAAVTI